MSENFDYDKELKQLEISAKKLQLKKQEHELQQSIKKSDYERQSSIFNLWFTKIVCLALIGSGIYFNAMGDKIGAYMIGLGTGGLGMSVGESKEKYEKSNAESEK